MEDAMQSAKEFTLRRFPRLSRWIFTQAEVDYAVAGSGLQAFSLGLNKRLADDGGRSGNLVYSPLSIYAAPSVVAAGARERTLDELLSVLEAPSCDALADHVRAVRPSPTSSTPAVPLSASRAACGTIRRCPSAPPTATLLPSRSRPSHAPSTSTIRSVQLISICTVDGNLHRYGAVVYNSRIWCLQPEEAAKQINAWVAKSTNDLIPSIISPGTLSPLTDLMLANAIYFKGRWEKPFHKKHTKEDKFHRLNGTDVDVPFMRGFGNQLVACHNGFKVLQLRYEQGWPLPAQPAPIYSMCVFLPDERDGLWRLTDKIACNPNFLRKHH
ncbi:hypothetical protein ACQ4PT_071466 [Festuca glaucescens]